MERHPEIFVYGSEVPDPLGVFGTTLGLVEKFGKDRVFDTPLSENAATGFGVGAALGGMHPLLVHARCDFILLTMDQIINHAASWKYVYGNNIPLTIRSVIGRGWGQAAQHSQSLQALFAHIPGLIVVMPSSAYDAKGLLISALEKNSPVIFIEHRWLHNSVDDVPEEYYKIPLGKAKILRGGSDVTIVGISYMNIEAIKAAKKLEERGISAEVIDLRTIKPWDKETVFQSVKKTGRLLLADTAWKIGGVGSEISAEVSENFFGFLKASVLRIGLPDFPAPAAASLEAEYYPDSEDIISAVYKIMERGEKDKKSISIIVPALNEEENLENAISNIISGLGSIEDYEILIISDGSTDRTGDIADALSQKDDRIKAIHHGSSQNLGGCFRAGLALASGEYTVMFPGDDETHPETIKNVFNSIGVAELIITHTINKEARTWGRRIVSGFYTGGLNFLFNLNLKYYNGPCLIKTDLLKSVPISSSFSYMSEILIRLIKAGRDYKEVPMFIKPQPGRRSSALKLKNLNGVLKTILRLIKDLYLWKK